MLYLLKGRKKKSTELHSSDAAFRHLRPWSTSIRRSPYISFFICLVDFETFMMMLIIPFII